jgi:hypothetical protein
MKFEFISQPIGNYKNPHLWLYALITTTVAASMLSRTGMMWFLHSCLATNNLQLHRILVGCMIVQVIVNSFTIIQRLVQCGPSPYHDVSSQDLSLSAVTDAIIV